MNTTTAPDSPGRLMRDGSTGLLLALASFAFLLHIVTNAFGGYGIFRDELYYLACSHHLAFGYVDQPPLSILILAINRLILGDSVFALRLLPALAGGLTVFLTGLLARELGGGRFAQLLACLASIVSLIFLGFDTIYSMNAFEIVFWAVGILLMVRILKSGDRRNWLWLGLVLGFGLMNKISVLWLGAGIGGMLLFTEQRRWLKTRWPWIAAGIAFLIFLPYVIWNITHDMATLEFMRNASGDKYAGLTPLTFLMGQFLVQNPVTAPLWLAGLYFLFGDRNGRIYRPLGFLYLIPLIILIANWHTKPEYLAPAYTLLFAAGGVMVERWLSPAKVHWLRPVVAVLLASGLMLAPLTLPILPVNTYIRYADALGVRPSTAERKELADLPQFYADMFGWEELAKTVAGVYHDLPPEEQTCTVVYTNNYGRAGAIDYYSEKYNLPPVYCGHNNYYLWPPPDETPAAIIIIGGKLEDHRQSLKEVHQVATKTCRHCMPYENNVPIYAGKGLKRPLAEIWPSTKHYD